jgi:hypothetical protein
VGKSSSRRNCYNYSQYLHAYNFLG